MQLRHNAFKGKVASIIMRLILLLIAGTICPFGFIDKPDGVWQLDDGFCSLRSCIVNGHCYVCSSQKLPPIQIRHKNVKFLGACHLKPPARKKFFGNFPTQTARWRSVVTTLGKKKKYMYYLEFALFTLTSKQSHRKSIHIKGLF